MDYRINNEALVACVAAQVVKNGNHKLSAVVGMTNLLMHDKERKHMLSSDNVEEMASIIGQLDGGLLTIIMNSIVMMIQGGCVTFGEDVLMLTDSGMSLCEQMEDRRSRTLGTIMDDIPAVMRKMNELGIAFEDNRYMIAL